MTNGGPPNLDGDTPTGHGRPLKTVPKYGDTYLEIWMVDRDSGEEWQTKQEQQLRKHYGDLISDLDADIDCSNKLTGVRSSYTFEAKVGKSGVQICGDILKCKGNAAKRTCIT